MYNTNDNDDATITKRNYKITCNIEPNIPISTYALCAVNSEAPLVAVVERAAIYKAATVELVSLKVVVHRISVQRYCLIIVISQLEDIPSKDICLSHTIKLTT